MIVGTKVILYLMASSAMIMFAEFPCLGVADNVDKCNPYFMKFHRTLYYVCVTLATVGFGVSH